VGQETFVGVDLGGTSLLATVVNGEGAVLGRAKRKTKARLGADAVIERITEAVTSAVGDADLVLGDVAGIGVGVPGPLDPASGVVHCCPNMGPTWENMCLVERLETLLARPVVIENDVNVGALGEYLYGAGRGSSSMLAIFVGTGIGGGLVLDGALEQGARNSAAEIGHMILLAEGPVCGCGQRGHAEALASRTAIERDIRAAIRGGRQSVMTELTDLSKRKPFTSSLIGQALAVGDPVVAEAVEKAQFYLGLLVASCVNFIDPNMVVVGGGLVESLGEGYLDPVRSVAEQHYINKGGSVGLVAAALGDLSGAIGAAAVARQRLGANPKVPSA